MNRKITLYDRLQDRGFIDQWGFMFFAVAGFIGIVFAKSFSISGGWVAVVAVIAMIAYAYVISKAGTGRLRADQAGDNCYYLGLIYTLASLSYAIATFDPANTASTIVQGFGVALATTIAGLILRVFFNQGRPDLENIEEQIRLDITDATSRLKSQLTDSVRQMSDFSHLLQQSIKETHIASRDSIQELTKSALEELKEVVKESKDSIQNETQNYQERSRKFISVTDKLLKGLEEHCDSLQSLNHSNQMLSQAAIDAKSLAESATVTMNALSEVAISATSAAKAADSTSSNALKLVENLNQSTGLLQQSIEAIREETDRQLLTLQNLPRDLVESSISSIRNGTLELKDQIAQIASLHDQVKANITSQAQEALNTSRKHNSELEAELSRSRELVTRVHNALTDMTEKLANTLEQT